MDTMVLLIDYSVVIIVHWNVGIRLIKGGGDGMGGKGGTLAQLDP